MVGYGDVLSALEKVWFKTVWVVPAGQPILDHCGSKTQRIKGSLVTAPSVSVIETTHQGLVCCTRVFQGNQQTQMVT